PRDRRERDLLALALRRQRADQREEDDDQNQRGDRQRRRERVADYPAFDGGGNRAHPLGKPLPARRFGLLQPGIGHGSNQPPRLGRVGSSLSARSEAGVNRLITLTGRTRKRGKCYRQYLAALRLAALHPLRELLEPVGVGRVVQQRQQATWLRVARVAAGAG